MEAGSVTFFFETDRRSGTLNYLTTNGDEKCFDQPF